VNVVCVLGDCPLLMQVELSYCRVRIAIPGAVATPHERCNAFLDQFLEPLARYEVVAVEHAQVGLEDMLPPPVDDNVPPACGALDLDLRVIEDLGALLYWAGQRGTPR
jgi:hypothetical protein